MAQLGQRLIHGAAKSMAADFFNRFDEAMPAAHPEAYAIKDVAEKPMDTRENGQKDAGIPVWVWVAGAVVLGLGLWIMKSFG